MNELTNRELATTIMLGGISLLCLLVPSLRTQVLPAFGDLLKAFMAWRIQLILWLYVGYIVGILALAKFAHLWSFDLLKDTLIIFFTVMFPLLFGALEIGKGSKLVSGVLKETLGVAALVALYLGLASFPLWGELIWQPIVTFLVLLQAVSNSQNGTEAVRKILNVTLGILGIWLLIYTTSEVIQTWSPNELPGTLLQLALSVWLPVAMLPFLYVFGFLAKFGSLMARLPFANGRKPLRFSVRLGIFIGLRFNLFWVSRLKGEWNSIGQATGFKDALKRMKSYRGDVRRIDTAEAQRLNNLKEFADSGATDAAGLQLDRREFGPTKRVLDDLYVKQLGQHRYQLGHFLPNAVDLLLSPKDLPSEPGVQGVLRKDKQAWYAWRRTPGGLVFAVGGNQQDIYADWKYAASSPPKTFPGPNNPEWTNTTVGERPPEWAMSDDPITSPRDPRL
ncbi:MAG: hypothetical protein IIZ13_14615 [Renibacterium sp.]|nr:hypothetical protein [Renibacterium sp.]